MALNTGEKLLNDSRLTIMHITFELQQATWKVFKGTKQKNISFVDCSILACMEAEGINKLLTFDRKDFKVLQKHHRFSFYS